jgi:hypothetical protein
MQWMECAIVSSITHLLATMKNKYTMVRTSIELHSPYFTSLNKGEKRGGEGGGVDPILLGKHRTAEKAFILDRYL